MGENITASYKRRRIRISHILTLVLLIAIGAFTFYRINLKHKLNARIEALRNAGYPVTLEELDQWYSIPDDSENAAYIILDSFNYFKKPLDESMLPFFGKVELPARDEAMPQKKLEVISQFISGNMKCLELLHKTAECEYGRYPVNFDFGYETSLPHLSEIRQLVWLLQLETIFFSERHEPNSVFNAITSNLGLINSLSREPVGVSELVRFRCGSLAVSSLEFAINRTAFSDEQLTKLGETFSKVQNYSSVSMSRVIAGEHCLVFNALKDPYSLENIFEMRKLQTLLYEVNKALGIIDKELVICLDLENQYLKALELPTYLRKSEFDAIYKEAQDGTRIYSLLHKIIPQISYIITLDLQNIAELQNAKVALAIQRYKLKNGKLPESIAELVPDYLESVPLDPFDGKELRYKKLEKGFVIYSIGQDLIDDNGRELQKDETRKSGETWDITFIMEN